MLMEQYINIAYIIIIGFNTQVPRTTLAQLLHILSISSQQKVTNHKITRLLGRPQPQMYPPVALNQYTWVNKTHRHFLYMLQGPIQILK